MAVSMVAKFIADEWFKLMAILCFVLLVLSITVDLKVDNALVGLFSLSGLLWGIGEMSCRPFRSRLLRSPEGVAWAKVTGRPRHINASSIVLFLLSLGVGSLGCLRGWPMVASLITTA